MSSIYDSIDPDGLLEYSVVYTDRATNHMSKLFQECMVYLSKEFRELYAADALLIVPGGGTFGMEAVARQFASGRHCFVIRNGWFSFRWTQIFESMAPSVSHSFLMARRQGEETRSPFAPCPLPEILEAIRKERPALVFAAHVETSAGMILPDHYLQEIASVAHEVGALFVLDCIASGTLRVDMRRLGVDILITAPQKGWSSLPGSGLILMSQRALSKLDESRSSSFAMDLKKWLEIMRAYEQGGFAYHATMPTDALLHLERALKEASAIGYKLLEDRQWELGTKVRKLLRDRGYPSVAAPGFEAPGVVVSYCEDEDMKKGLSLAKSGIQAAAGIPLMCDEGTAFKTFRLGLFGLDKLNHIERTVAILEKAL